MFIIIVILAKYNVIKERIIYFMIKNLMKKENIYKLLEWIIKIIGYSLILIITSLIFKNTLYIDKEFFGLWSLLASIIIYFLNKTVKPILFRLTIPITGITLGLFYPFINLIILKIVAFILYPHFQIFGIWYAVCAAILISILNLIMDGVLDKLKRKEK